MQPSRIPCFYHPTTTLLVDDSNRFLNNIALTLEKTLPYKLCNDPVKTLSDLQGNVFNTLPSEIISSDLTSENYGTFTEKYPLSLNISKLHQAIYDPSRFAQVSVIVVDYVMPKMNGLEFCEQLEGTAIKKILLTGEADEMIAVRAFNNGLIDKFIVKSEPEMNEMLVTSIRQLQKRNFQELSELIIKGLPVEPGSCILDPNFIIFFDKLCQDLEITDYYLIDTSGSFLLLNREGTVTWLIIKNEEEMEEFTSYAIDTNASTAVIEALNKREKTIYFNKLQDYIHLTGTQWEKVLYPIQKLEGVGKHLNYFYCIVKELPTFSFESDKIVSLKDYIERS